MNQARIACVCLVLSGCLASPAWAQKNSLGGVKIYLLSGGQRQHHGYRDQAFYLAELLENTGRFEVTLGEDAAILEMPAIQKYALIIANANRRNPVGRGVGQGGRPGAGSLQGVSPGADPARDCGV